MQTVSVTCTIEPNTEQNRQIVIAALEQLNYDGFEETSNRVVAYISEKHFNPRQLKECQTFKEMDAHVKYTIDYLEDKDWNRVWEENYFKPIVISNQCVIRSEFHKNTPDLPYEIIINPKMAFGTGHHETTRLMMEQMFKQDFKGKEVLDMGTGTGVLAVLSKMLGASGVTAIDVEGWAYRNASENVRINKQHDIEVRQGDASAIPNKLYDVVLANINFNVITKDIATYAKSLQSGGFMILSGFYTYSVEELKPLLHKNSLQIEQTVELNNWALVVCTKS